VRILLPGYGLDHRGFVLHNLEDDEGDTAVFRSEYAKAIKKGLEGV
jgi:hypothetical protein